MKVSVFFVIFSFLLLIGVFTTPLFSVLAETNNDPFLSEQWYLSKIHVFEAWEESTGSQDVIVAILDAGVDLDHPDIVNQFWKNKNEIPNNQKDDDHNGYDYD